MKRRGFVAGVVCAALAPAASFAQAVEWQEIVGEEGRYRLQMPRGYQEISGPRPDGSTARQYRMTSPQGFGIEFAITDYVKDNPGHPPTDLGARLRDAERAVQQRWPGSTVLEQSDVQLGPAQGRSFTLEVDRGQGVLIVRLYYSSQRLYTQLALARRDQRQNPVIVQFMNSLRIER